MRKGMRKRLAGVGALASAMVLLTAAEQPLLWVAGGGPAPYRTGDGTTRALETGGAEPWDKTFYTADSRLEPDPAMETGVAKTLPEGMTLLCRDEDLELYLDDGTTSFAVRDIRSGCVWTSAPQDTALDKVAVGDNRNRLSALVMIEYYTADGAVQTYDSYNHSVAFENFTVEKQANGFTAVYQIGRQRTVTSGDVPNILYAERLESFLEKLEGNKASDTRNRYRLYSLSKARTEEARQKMLAEYPTVANGDIYVLKNKDDTLLYMIRDNLAAAGYTAEDLERDNADHGIQTKTDTPEVFQVALNIRLENGRLIAEVDGSRLKSPDKMPVQVIHVLPFFGAANLASRGYMLVPDGSGGLVYLNSFSSSPESLSLPLYGRDLALRQAQEKASAMPVCLPVYGMKNGENGFVAVIEQGDGVGNINCAVPGLQNSYNCVWPSFSINQRDSFEALSTGYLGGGVFTTLYPDRLYDGPLRVAYTFLETGRADYGEMAAVYRGYLKTSGGLTAEKLTGSALPFLLETVGAADMPASFLGLIQYDKTVPLTTFEQTGAILEALGRAGVSDIRLRLSGWMNGGLSQSPADSVRVMGALGGRKGLEALLETVGEQGASLYADVQLQTICKPGVLYSKKSNAVRYLGNVYANLYRYDMPSGNRLEDSKQYLLSPLRLPALADKVAASFAGLGLSGICVRDLGNRLYADYNGKQFATRDDSIAYTRRALEALAGVGGRMVDGGNAYALAYADLLLNVPVGGSGYRRINETVPFYQMVLHGYLPYAGTPMNHTDDPQTYALRCVEYGAIPYYQWSWAASSLVKQTYYSDMYALCHTDTFDRAVEFYRRLNDETGSLYGQAITGHRTLAEGVSATGYENGRWVVVNYNGYAVEIGGVSVDAYDWTVAEGGVEA